MLTVGRVKEKEGTLLAMFVGFHDTLTAIGQHRLAGKKALESIMDMTTEKTILNRRMEDLDVEAEL